MWSEVVVYRLDEFVVRMGHCERSGARDGPQVGGVVCWVGLAKTRHSDRPGKRCQMIRGIGNAKESREMKQQSELNGIVQARQQWTLCINPQGRFTNELVVRPTETERHGLWVADVGSQDDPGRIADGHLLASAPELHALVEVMESWLRCGDLDPAQIRLWRAQARAVLRRADRGQYGLARRGR